MGPLFMKRGMYFSDQEGGALVDYVLRSGIELGRQNLDFGCGPGYLIGHMLRRGIAISGADFSSEAVAQVRRLYGGDPRFGGAELTVALPTQYPARSFDTIFLLETVEHLLDDDLTAIASEVHRLLKPGGHLVVSTPNNQELWREEIMCPDCGCEFHVTQHVRSWTRDSLSNFLAGHGFLRVKSEAKFLGPTRWHSMLLPLLKRRRPHLIYIGRKS